MIHSEVRRIVDAAAAGSGYAVSDVTSRAPNVWEVYLTCPECGVFRFPLLENTNRAEDAQVTDAIANHAKTHS